MAEVIIGQRLGHYLAQTPAEMGKLIDVTVVAKSKEVTRVQIESADREPPMSKLP